MLAKLGSGLRVKHINKYRNRGLPRDACRYQSAQAFVCAEISTNARQNVWHNIKRYPRRYLIHTNTHIHIYIYISAYSHMIMESSGAEMTKIKLHKK